MSADDATPETFSDAEPTQHPGHTSENGVRARSSGHTRRTAAYSSMQRTMTDLS